jgi:hypothetical protein
VFFDSGGTPVGDDELRRVLRMEEVGDEGSQTKMKGFTWRWHSQGRWSQRRCSSSISTTPTHFRQQDSDETQGRSSVEVSECSGVDERTQSGGMAHGAQGDSFAAEAVSREKGWGVHSARGSKERGVGGVGATRGWGAPGGRHYVGVVEVVVDRANREVEGGGVWHSGPGGRVVVMGRLLWARPNRTVRFPI